MSNNLSTEALKIMPWQCTKDKLMQMYCKQMPFNDIRKEINTIIAANRKLQSPRNIRVKMIRHKELQEFIEIHGLPNGYKEWDNE